MSLLILLLQITAAASQSISHSFAVRAGDEVTLPCENVIDGQQKCDGTTWTFVGSGSTAAVELIKLGQIGKNAKAKSDRLNVTANCSLVIKKVTVEDAGHYFCQQYKSGSKQAPDSEVHLSVINMTEHEDTDKVTLTCSVFTPGQCRHTVKWLFEGNDVDKDNKDMKTSQTDCSATVTFKIYTSKNYKLSCNVTDIYTKEVQLFTFSRQSSGETTGEDTTVATTTKSKTITTMGRNWWRYILVAVGLAALLITVVAVVRRRRAKANKTQMSDNIELTSNPAVTQSGPETSQDTADPEDVFYASISCTRNTNSKAWIWGDDDAVTYSTVKASSSSAGASADPSNLYATVNKAKKNNPV